MVFATQEDLVVNVSNQYSRDREFAVSSSAALEIARLLRESPGDVPVLHFQDSAEVAVGTQESHRLRELIAHNLLDEDEESKLLAPERRVAPHQLEMRVFEAADGDPKDICVFSGLTFAIPKPIQVALHGTTLDFVHHRFVLRRENREFYSLVSFLTWASK